MEAAPGGCSRDTVGGAPIHVATNTGSIPGAGRTVISAHAELSSVIRGSLLRGGAQLERNTSRIIGTVYPVTCAISSSVSPARCAITIAFANASFAVAYSATRSKLRSCQGAWREVPTQDGVGGVGFLYAVIAFGPQSA
jgi:hypothetical protein